MFEIKKKKKSGFPSANPIGEGKVPSAGKINPGEFSAKANLAALKKPSVGASIKEVGEGGFKGSESVKEEELESANSAYIDRIKKRAKK